MDIEPCPKVTPYLAKVSYDIFRRIALSTLSLGTHPPTPQDLRTLCCLPLVSPDFRDAICFTKNPELYAQVFRLMFDIDAVQRRLGSESTTASSVSSELQNRTRVLGRIKTHLGDGSELETLPPDDQSVLEDHAVLLLMVLENEGKNMQQLYHAGAGRRFSTLIASLINEGRSPKMILQLPFLVPLIWLTGSSGIIVKGNPQHREDVLDFLHPFVVRKYQVGATKLHEEQPSIMSVGCFGVTLKVTHPDLVTYARLCTFSIFHAAETVQGTLSIVIIRNNTHRYDGVWRRCVSVGSPEPQSPEPTTVAQLFPLYSMGTFSGIWKGSFFIPIEIHGDTETAKHQTCEVTMQCCLTEYHSPTAEGSVTWENEEGSESSLARAWLPMGVQLYETEGSLMIYDPMKLGWLCYKSHVHSTGDIFDTIILGTTYCNQYKLHGRVRHRDGLVALVRTPIDPMYDFLGTWVFQGQVHEQTEFVGDWRCASSSEVAPGRQGWFKWLKDCD